MIERDRGPRLTAGAGGSMRVLMVTCEWPTPERPGSGPFIAQQARWLGRSGVDVEVYDFLGGRSLLAYVRAWREVHRRIRGGRFDLVHAQFGQSGLPALFPKRSPLVVTFRGDDLEGIVGQGGRYLLIGRVLRILSRIVARRADALVVVSAHMAPALPKPAAVIPSGLDLALFRPHDRGEAREALDLPRDVPLVLFAGDPEDPRKRLPLAREAVERAGAHLVVAWGMPRDRMPLFMSACDALVFTSLHEGSPNVVKESLACGLPVVSVDVGDVARWLRPVQGCTVCDSDRPEVIAEALTRTLAMRSRVDASAVIGELDEAVLTDRLIGIYGAVIAGRELEAAR